MTGKIHSFQSLGTVDGPGVRFVVFMHGCNLSCGYCQNIDVVCGEYSEYTPEEVMDKIIRFKEYFNDGGGVTVSGGEPLLQAEFLKELLMLCKENGISTAIDTAGAVLNDEVLELFEYVDLVLLDIKMTNDTDYKKYIGCSLSQPVEFLKELEERNIPCWIRQVIVEGINDSEQNIIELSKLISNYKCVKKVELLPFRKLCQEKYLEMGIEFPFDKFNQTSKETINKLNSILDEHIKF